MRVFDEHDKSLSFLGDGSGLGDNDILSSVIMNCTAFALSSKYNPYQKR